MCRGSVMNFSMKTRSSPKDDLASAFASLKPSATSALRMRDAHALAAAAGGSLDHHGIADLVGDLHRVPVIVDDAEMARHGRDLGLRGGFLGLDLVTHRGDRIRIGADEDDARFLQRARKRFAFGQEAVTGMDGFGAGRLAGLDDLLDDEIAFGRGRRPDEDRVVGHLDMQRVAVGLGIDGDRRNSHLAGGLDDATGDLAAVCDQYPFEHVLLGWPWAGSSPAIWHAGPGVTIALPAKCGCANVLFPFRLSVAASQGRNARSARRRLWTGSCSALNTRPIVNASRLWKDRMQRVLRQ